MATDKIDELKKGIEIPGCVSLVKGQGDLPMIKVKTDTSTAEIYLHGAHVSHFQKKDEPPILWMSQKSKFDEHSPIRGGIPIIFPWFGGRPGSPAHGFARSKAWDLQEVTLMPGGGVSLHFHLPESAQSDGFSGFTADYTVNVSNKLELQLRVTNTAANVDFVFEDCLHTYFTVGDIGAVSVTGLKGVKYLDKVIGGEHTESNDAITISSEVDRVFMDTMATVEIHDGKLHRKLRVEKSGSNATVVWNPWIAKSKAMADFGDEEYHNMVCVESGNVGRNNITLAPGKTATLIAKLSSAAL